jgi:exopolyphosphatase/guanosine-5'-triphosphate,3'-diphosphate pyrophosphatase
MVRRPPPAKFAAIDVGTNSIHLVMAEISSEGDFEILGSDKDMVQLGKGGFADHILTPEAMAAGIATLRRFKKMAELKRIARIRAVATSAVREATNGGDFVKRVLEELELELHVISPREEGRLIYLGVRHAVDLGTADNLIVASGGGSVELVVVTAHEASLIASVKLGGSRLAELLLASDPPQADEVKALRAHLRAQLDPILSKIASHGIARCVGCSGTIKCLAMLCRAYRDRASDLDDNVLKIAEPELRELTSVLVERPRSRRLDIPGMDDRRVDAVIPAAFTLLAILKGVGVPSIEYCDAALREGVIVDYIAQHRRHLLARATWPDPRRRSAVQFAEKCGYVKAHAEQVARLALDLFDQLENLHGLGREYRELLFYAGLLHDIGYMISQKGHHKHSYYLIRNGELKGFEDQEIEIIANIARYHRKDRPKKSHYSFGRLRGGNRTAVRRLSVLLRIANALDRTHYSVVERVECTLTADAVNLQIRTSSDAELEMWTTKRHAELFEREFGLRLQVHAVQPDRCSSAPERPQPPAPQPDRCPEG